MHAAQEIEESGAEDWTQLLDKAGKEKAETLRAEQKAAFEEGPGKDNNDNDNRQKQNKESRVGVDAGGLDPGIETVLYTADGVESKAAIAAAAMAKMHRLHPELIESPATEACRFLGPELCAEHFQDAVDTDHATVSTAIRLLRRGRAGSLCDQVGRSRCHESLEDATRFGHVGIVAAIRALIKRSKQELKLAASQKQRAANAANAEFRAAQQIASEMRRRNLTWSNKPCGVDKSTLPQNTSRLPCNESASANATDVMFNLAAAERKAAQAEDAALEALTALQAPEQTSVSYRGDNTSDTGFGASTPVGARLNAATCDRTTGTQTADCYCRLLGTRRCSETLYSALMNREPDTVHAIRTLLGGRAPGPAVRFCISLGPALCKETLDVAQMKCHHEVVKAWNYFRIKQPGGDSTANEENHPFGHKKGLVRAWRNCSGTTSRRGCPTNAETKEVCGGSTFGHCFSGDPKLGPTCVCHRIGWGGPSCDEWVGDAGWGCLGYEWPDHVPCSGHGRCDKLGRCTTDARIEFRAHARTQQIVNGTGSFRPGCDPGWGGGDCSVPVSLSKWVLDAAAVQGGGVRAKMLTPVRVMASASRWRILHAAAPMSQRGATAISRDFGVAFVRETAQNMDDAMAKRRSVLILGFPTAALFIVAATPGGKALPVMRASTRPSGATSNRKRTHSAVAMAAATKRRAPASIRRSQIPRTASPGATPDGPEETAQ